MEDTNHALLPLSQARSLLVKANTVDAVKAVRDKAQALALYAKQAQYGIDIQNECAELKIRAERKAGELLKETVVAHRPKEVFHRETLNSPGKLPEGISRTQSHRWQQAASVPEETFESHVAEVKAKKEELTSAGVRRLAQQHQQKEPVAPPPLPVGVYDVIYADPPWRYDFPSTTSRAIENQYPTMDLEEIKILPVPSADDAALFLWATAPKLTQALEVMDAWGFTYRTHAVWDKEKMGMGYWFRGQHELLLVGVKGSFAAPRPDVTIRSVIRAPRSEHSRKPDAVYDIIEALCPRRAYLELFARENTRSGWTAWGHDGA